jgi:signal transduction histidine kinase
MFGKFGLKTLTLRIYSTVVAVLLLFAVIAGWFLQNHIDQERIHSDQIISERFTALGELLSLSLPSAQASSNEQAQALLIWAKRLRLGLALNDVQGGRIAISDEYEKRLTRPDANLVHRAVLLKDGRTLWIMPPQQGITLPSADSQPWFRAWEQGRGSLMLLLAVFVSVAAGAWLAATALTKRLEALKAGMEIFGAGQLSHRVEIIGHDEVAAVVVSFNAAAARIENLVKSHQSLLGHASHELRSPLARLKIAISLLDEAQLEKKIWLQEEINKNIAELDELVEEVLLASRLDAGARISTPEQVDLLTLVGQECAQVEATLQGTHISSWVEEKLVRRAVRNLLQNAKRYGGAEIHVSLNLLNSDDPEQVSAEIRVYDRGPGVPSELSEKIFEPFYRLSGHIEKASGVGLGLSLVRQIALRHGGQVRCETREGGGSCFVLTLKNQYTSCT